MLSLRLDVKITLNLEQGKFSSIVCLRLILKSSQSHQQTITWEDNQGNHVILRDFLIYSSDFNECTARARIYFDMSS